MVGYASGKNESLFMQHIDTGMFALMTKEGSTLLVDDTFDDDDKILGLTLEEGMLMMPDDALIDSIRVSGVVHANVGQKLLICYPFKSFLW